MNKLCDGFYDLDKNVLIKKTCRCQDILHCVCPDREKYSVKLADFDYIRRCSRVPVDLLHTQCKWFNYCGGTLTYRAPEVSMPHYPRSMCVCVCVGGDRDKQIRCMWSPAPLAIMVCRFDNSILLCLRIR